MECLTVDGSKQSATSRLERLQPISILTVLRDPTELKHVSGMQFEIDKGGKYTRHLCKFTEEFSKFAN